MLKSLAVGAGVERLLVDAGRVSAEKLAKALEEGDYAALPQEMQVPCRQAHEVLSATGDPQQSDFILDAAYFQEMLHAAEETGSELLVGLCPRHHRRGQPPLGGAHGADAQGRRLPAPGAL